MNLKTFPGQKIALLLVFLPLPLVVAKVGAMFLTSGNKIAFAAQCLLLAAVFFGPGMALLPFMRRWLPRTPPLRFGCIVLTSIFACSFVSWTMYYLGLYTRTAALVFSAIIIGFLLFGIARFPWRVAASSVFEGFATLSWIDKLGLALCVWFLTFSTLRSFEPFSTWDALVSWDKWGRDMATRNGLGGYVMGAYPQLIPTIYSLFYKNFAPVDTTIIPDATYFAHAANGLFDWLIVPAGLVLCKRLGASLLLFSAFFFGSGVLIEWFASGYVDTATTAVFLFTSALVVDWMCDPTSRRLASAVLCFIPSAATLCFVKGQGMLLTLFATLFIFCRPIAGNYRKAAVAVAALAAGAVLVLPYPIHQRLVWNSGRAETDVRLHTMPVRVENPAAVAPSFPLAKKYANEFVRSYVPPFAEATPAYTVFVAIVIALGLALSLRKRQMLPIAIAAAIGWAIWFRFAAYDWRNASQIASLTVLCAAAGLRFKFARSGLIKASSAFECLVALALSGNALAFMSVKPVQLTPSLWRLAPDQRPSALCGPRYDLLSHSPLTNNASRVFTQNTDVWLLGHNAVYLWHPFANMVSPQPSDVAAVFRDQLEGLDRGVLESFELVSGFQSQVLGMVQPSYDPVAAILQAEDLEVPSQPLPAEISEPGTYWIHSEIKAGAGDVVLYDFEVDVSDYSLVRMVVGRDWNDVTSYRNICDFIQKGPSFRVMLWLDRVPPGTFVDKLPPVALVKSGNAPATVKSANVFVLQASKSAMGEAE